MTIGNNEVVKVLLDRGANVNATDEYGAPALCCAAETRATEIVKLLLDRGANVNIRNKEGLTPLAIAIVKGTSGSGGVYEGWKEMIAVLTARGGSQ